MTDVKVRQGASVQEASSGQTLEEILNELGIESSAPAFSEGEQIARSDVPDPGTIVELLGAQVARKG